MAIDSYLGIRNGILSALKANADLTAIVPSSRIYTQTTLSEPKWPFIMYGSGISSPVRASCLDGQEMDVTIHVYAKPRKSGTVIVEPAEAYAARISALVSAALDRSIITLDRGKARIRWTGSRCQQDGSEADRFHAFVDFRVRAFTV